MVYVSYNSIKCVRDMLLYMFTKLCKENLLIQHLIKVRQAVIGSVTLNTNFLFFKLGFWCESYPNLNEIVS